MAIYDFKKEYKELYSPKKPSIINVPKMNFIMVKGKGNPNTASEYKTAIEILYGLSYTIKMSKMGENQPVGYFDYVVPPLEGLWWFENDYFDGNVIDRKDEFVWIMMIRQPDFVTNEVLEIAKSILKKKKPNLDTSRSRLEEYQEGLCGQVIHLGAFDEEKATVAELEKFIEANGYKTKMDGLRQHHEIYLSDPRKTEQAKLRTIIRHPIIEV